MPQEQRGDISLSERVRWSKGKERERERERERSVHTEHTKSTLVSVVCVVLGASCYLSVLAAARSCRRGERQHELHDNLIILNSRLGFVSQVLRTSLCDCVRVDCVCARDPHNRSVGINLHDNFMNETLHLIRLGPHSDQAKDQRGGM